MKKKLPRVSVPHKLYIIMRDDIQSMNPGKAMAQAAHAANQFIAEYGELDTVQLDWCGDNPFIQSKRHFGTTIVLAADIDNLDNAIGVARMKKVPCGIVSDPTYPFMTTEEIARLIPADKLSAPTIFKEDGKVVMFRNELTCGYVFVADGSIEQQQIVGHLSLHP